MTNITSAPEVQTDRDQRIQAVRDAVHGLDVAIYDLSSALSLDDGDVPESERELAAGMSKYVEEVRNEFDRFDFLGWIEELQELTTRRSKTTRGPRHEDHRRL